MAALTRDDLFSLEQYAEKRAEFRQQVLAHKKNRKVTLGGHASLYFEDKLTVQYQIQEMLRIEKVFEAAGIEEELEAYNPLIPDGSNLKATFMIEYPDVEQRKQVLSRLVGIEDKVWIQFHGLDKVYAIADEDLERDTAEKTSAVHFMRFEFTAQMIAAAKEGASMAIGIDHENFREVIDPLPEIIREALVADFSD